MLALDRIARHLFLERQARFWARSLNGRWSPGELRARVLEVKDETGDAKTFVLAPEAGWQGHRAGQFITVVLEIDGVRLRRCYSLSSSPSDRTLQITVKRAAAGRVSRWLHDHVRRGQVLRISAAAGEFVLPDRTAARLLFVTGGSGITPVMSMLRELDRRGVVGDVVLVHHARSRSDVIFGAELEALAGRHAGLRVCLGLSDAADGQGRFDEARLAALVPDFAERATYLCGPPGLMARVERMWERAGATGQLRRERFGASPAVQAAPAHGLEERSRQVRLLRSGRTHTLGERTLLDELERAGEQPRHGCRIGICHTCRCHKRSGTVRNVLTGAVSSEPDQDIQLCISIACSDLELGL